MNLDIKINNIFLVANNFVRDNHIDDDIWHNINANIEIKYDFSENKKNIAVMFTYILDIPAKDNSDVPQISYSSVHFAELEIDNYIEDTEYKSHIDKFINVNVAAMIFPFIREHLATTTMKAGMAPIIIPSINFIERYKNKNSTK